MILINKGDRLRVKDGTTAKAKASSMIHWQKIPNIDGEIFTVKKTTRGGKGCYLDLPGIAQELYELTSRDLEKI